MRTRITIIAIAMMALSGTAYSAEADVQKDEIVLVGRWQQGLTANLRNRPQGKLSRVFAGDVLDFSADHTFRLYPKCGREKNEWEKRGVSYLGGEWKIIASHRLHVVMGALGKTLERDMEFEINGDDLIFISPSNPHDQFGRFGGKVPQQCSVGRTGTVTSYSR